MKNATVTNAATPEAIIKSAIYNMHHLSVLLSWINTSRCFISDHFEATFLSSSTVFEKLDQIWPLLGISMHLEKILILCAVLRSHCLDFLKTFDKIPQNTKEKWFWLLASKLIKLQNEINSNKELLVSIPLDFRPDSLFGLLEQVAKQMENQKFLLWIKNSKEECLFCN